MAAAAVVSSHRHHPPPSPKAAISSPNTTRSPELRKKGLSPTNGSRSHPNQNPMASNPNPNAKPQPQSQPQLQLQPQPQPQSQPPPVKSTPIPRGKRERPCDACRRRKSKCVVTEGSKVCAACGSHGQKCTYVEDPQPRKRKVEGEAQGPDSSKRRSQVSPISNVSSTDSTAQAAGRAPPSVSKPFVPPASALQSYSQHCGTLVGHTTELEPLLFRLGSSKRSALYDMYEVRDQIPFLLSSPNESLEGAKRASLASAKTLQQAIGPHGPLLIKAYLRNVHPIFPVVPTSFFTAHLAGSIQTPSPLLLSAIFTSTTSFAPALASPPDFVELESLSFSLFASSLSSPTLATIQAGILLLQRPGIDARALNTQLVSAAFDLGLHIDPSAWGLSGADTALRKRLAWAVFVQDKWSALVHGRPSLIVADDWTVPQLEPSDFESEEIGDRVTTDETKNPAEKADRGSIGSTTAAAAAAAPADGNSPSSAMDPDSQQQQQQPPRGAEVFIQLVRLSAILATVLETFYTLKATAATRVAPCPTRHILERAKPVQIRLKEWFSSLRPGLRMDSASVARGGDNDMKVTGEGNVASGAVSWLHLAYFATEISLHRCIVRSLHRGAGSERGIDHDGEVEDEDHTPRGATSTNPTSPLPRTSRAHTKSSTTTHSIANNDNDDDPDDDNETSSSSSSPSPRASPSASTSPTLPRSAPKRSTSGPDPLLTHICRAAAKTRLISAMDFVNRLRPLHFRALGGLFAAKSCFGLIASFGALLRATAPGAEEEMFYGLRMKEFRWTLGVSWRGVVKEVEKEEEEERGLLLREGVGAGAGADLGVVSSRSVAAGRGGEWLAEAIAWVDVWDEICEDLGARPEVGGGGGDGDGSDTRAHDTAGGRGREVNGMHAGVTPIRGRGPAVASADNVQAVRFAQIRGSEGEMELGSPGGSFCGSLDSGSV